MYAITSRDLIIIGLTSISLGILLSLQLSITKEHQTIDILYGDNKAYKSFRLTLEKAKNILSVALVLLGIIIIAIAVIN
jgi:hypothetical protein